jgi:hypothetical protein
LFEYKKEKMGNMSLMKPKKRQKLCHNCEGEIDLDVIVCPFCAADLREEKPEQRQSSSYHPSFLHANQQTNQSLYPSAYSMRQEEEKEASPVESAELPPQSPSERIEPEPKNIFAPMIFFTLGVQLFLFGFLMLLFSHKGVVILKWDAHFWFWYVFASLPLLYFGYKKL